MEQYEEMEDWELEDICVDEMGTEFVEDWCENYGYDRQSFLDLIHDYIA